MRKRVKSPMRFIASVVLLFICLVLIGKALFNKEQAADGQDSKSATKETLSENVLLGNLIDIEENGNINLEESPYFKKYSISLAYKDDYIDYEQNEAYIYLYFKNPESHRLSQQSFQEQDKNVFLTEVKGKDTLVVKKNFEYNNFVFLNELTNSLVILVSKQEEPYKYSVVLDPGHGGVDPGTEAFDKSFWEKDITLKIAREIRPELMFNGFEVSMSREEDTTIRLEDVVKYTKGKNPDVFASIHINAYEKSNKYNGISVYYSKDNAVTGESKALASFIQEHIISSDGWNDREVKAENFYVIKNNPMPAVLIECGFASNPEDVARLKNDNTLNNLSKNISKGIIEYLKEK
jgi:N-acetylmuramoyl-L-alanine amidase